MRNPRPCVCGHAPNYHRPHHRQGGWIWVNEGCLCCGCLSYEGAPRIGPLRVLRNPVVIRPLWEKAR
jgi:hypothetical protein